MKICGKIKEVKELCAKDYEHVSHSWEALMDDVELQEIEKTSWCRVHPDQFMKFFENITSIPEFK